MDAVVKVVALREEEHDLLQWCLAHDVVVADIAAAVAAGWRGVVATAHIQAGSCILRVPRALLMSNESARRDERLQQHLLGTNLTPVQVRWRGAAAAPARHRTTRSLALSSTRARL